jgi:site-specific DNA-methyltransferase (adenine-specific)
MDLCGVESKEVVYGQLRKYGNIREHKREFGEVFTPLDVVDTVLDYLPADVWTNSSLHWFEPAVGVGHFIVPVFFRLMDGLKSTFPNIVERRNHIIRNMLYMSEINPKNSKICRSIFGNDANIHTGDTLHVDFQKLWNIDRFDVVFGNPPYQQKPTGRGCVIPLYNLFVDHLIDKCNTMLFILPSRWFGSGKGLGSFRKSMLLRKDIKRIQHYDNSTMLFPGHQKIMGGVCVVHKDASHCGYCYFNFSLCDLNKYDILVPPRFQSILDKVLMKMETNLSTICYGQNYSGIKSNDTRLCSKASTGYYKCYISNKSGFFKYVPPSALHNRDYDKWKVLTVEANGYWKYFGRTEIGAPGDVCNQSFIVFEVDDLDQAVSLCSLLNTKLINFLMGIRKCSQHINPDTCKWIPLLPLNRIYSDAFLYDLYHLDCFEIALLDELYSFLILKKMYKDINNLFNQVHDTIRAWKHLDLTCDVTPSLAPLSHPSSC